MNEPTKPATDDPIPTTGSAVSGGSSAPPEASESAPIDGETTGNVPERHDPAPKPPNDDSPRKNRFMIALLDKLGVNGKASDDAKEDGQKDPIDATLISNGPRDKDRPRSLADTHASDANPAPRPMTFTYPPGSTPLERYTIRRGIGMGGFGEVYFAVSEAGKEVALKRIQRNLEVELRGVSHCLNLKHPNLVSLFDICHDSNDQSWVVMEYVAGPNLREVLDQSPNGLPKEEARRWFTAIAAGVSHLHSAGLVHRDLKPGNVFDDLGTIKVGDYGLSKFISASHRGGHTESVGTFHYMAPEIGRGQYGREIDVYALGIMLYELLTGQVPFDGESCHEIIVKHLTATPDLSGISEPYRSTISKSLEKDPTKRFPTVEAMTDSLRLDGGSRLAEVEEPVPAVLVAESVPTPPPPPVDADEPIHEATIVPEPSPARRRHGGYVRAAHSDEPFARAIRDSFADLKRWWATLDRSPGAKAFMLVVAAFVLIINTHWLLPLLSIVAFFYVPYYIARQMVLHARQQPTYAEAQRIATAAGASRRPITRAQWRNHMRTDLRAKRSIHRVAELNTSWIAATLTAVGMALGTGVIGLRSETIDATALAPFGWMTLIVLIASLGLLGMGKLWEREEGEGLPRRLVLAGVGASVGLAAYSLGDFLMLPMDTTIARDVDATTLPQALYSEGGRPLPAAMMAHFALLFAALRWWKPVDPLRRTRLSLWAVAVAVVGEWAIHQILPIPQPWGMLMAGGTAIAVQMAAPWINPRAMRPRPQGTPTDDQTVGTRSLA